MRKKQPPTTPVTSTTNPDLQLVPDAPADPGLTPPSKRTRKPAAKAPAASTRAASLEGTTPLGRPAKLTPAAQRKFLSAVKIGTPYETCCKLAGISYQTFMNWRRRAEAAAATSAKTGEPIPAAEVPFVEFLEALDAANAEAERVCLARINTAGRRGDWRADAFLLERRIPERYGRRDTIKTVGDPNEPQFNVNLSAGEHIAPEDIVAVLSRYKSAQALSPSTSPSEPAAFAEDLLPGDEVLSPPEPTSPQAQALERKPPPAAPFPITVAPAAPPADEDLSPGSD